MTEHSGPSLGHEELRGMFQELSDGLAQRGATAQLFVVGGAAMALAYDSGRFTRDVDAVFEPTGTVRELSAQLAARHGLEDDWINDAAKGFLPGQDAGARTVFETDNLLVQVASPEYLLAMKLHSGRAARDLGDAVTLWNRVGYRTPEEGIALLDRTYPARLLLPRHRFVVEDVASRATAARSNTAQKRLADHLRRDESGRLRAVAQPSASKERSAVQASYPRAAAEATRRSSDAAHQQPRASSRRPGREPGAPGMER